MDLEDKRIELEKLQIEAEIRRQERKIKMEAIDEYSSYGILKSIGVGAATIGGLEFLSPELLVFLSMDPTTALFVSGSGLGLLGGKRVQTFLLGLLGGPKDSGQG